MDEQSIAAQLQAEWHVIGQAPMSFAAAVIVAGFVIWLLVKREYATRLANAASTNEMLEKWLDRFQAEEAIAIDRALHQRAEAPAPLSDQSEHDGASARPEPKVYTEYDATYFLDLFEGRTSLQAQKLYESEIDKWMIVKGEVAGVAGVDGGEVQIAVNVGFMRFVFCYFWVDKTPGLERLSVGQSVRLEGRIESIKTRDITLVDCALRS